MKWLLTSKKNSNVFVSRCNLLFRFLSEEMQLLEEVGLSQRHSYNRARLFRKSNEWPLKTHACASNTKHRFICLLGYGTEINSSKATTAFQRRAGHVFPPHSWLISLRDRSQHFSNSQILLRCLQTGIQERYTRKISLRCKKIASGVTTSVRIILRKVVEEVW